MEALQIFRGKKRTPCPQLPCFNYFPDEDKQTGLLTASDKIEGWAGMRTDKDDFF